MEVKIKKHFFVTGYTGEGAKRMLGDLQGMENVELIDRIIDNRLVRFLYYRIDRLTSRFQKCHFLKNVFYPWFNILRADFRDGEENCILFLNSGFCHELDGTLVEKLKKKNKNLKLILYIVDPIAGFCMPEHWDIMKKMDVILAVNREDCDKYGFYYFPLIYSKDDREASGNRQQDNEVDLYYLGSGADRTEVLTQICRKCQGEGIKTDFHVLGRGAGQDEGKILFHSEPVPYRENIKMLLRSNCILEIMHKDFDNPTQRYSEAVVYNKKLLTNNRKITTFEFYDPRYMQVFQSLDEISADFVTGKEIIDYGYCDEFSPRLLVWKITDILEAG